MRTSSGGGASGPASTSARRPGAGSAPPSARAPPPSPADRLAAVDLPILIVGAEHDRLVSAAAIRRVAADAAACRARNAARCRPRNIARGRSGPPARPRPDRRLPCRAGAVSGRFDVAIIGAGMAGASLAAEIAGAASVAAPRGGEPAGLSFDRPLRRLLVGDLWRAADPAADQRVGGLACRFPEPAGRDPHRRCGRAGRARRARRRVCGHEGRARAARPRRSGGAAPRARAGLGRGPVRAELRRHRRRRPPRFLSRPSEARAAPSCSPTGGSRGSSGRRLAGGSTAAFEARILVNAAGAWADEVAILAGERPIGIQAYRRTIAQLRVEPPAPADLPLVVDASGRFYFKPEAGGRLWLSPHDETPCRAAAIAPPRRLDVAVAIDRLERAGRLAGRAGRAQMGGPPELRARPAAGLRLQPVGTRLLLVRGAGRLRHPDRPRRCRARRCAAARDRARRRRSGSLCGGRASRPHRRRRRRGRRRGRSRRWPLWPFTQCHSTRCGAAASTSSCQSSAFFTGFLSAVRQPFLRQPWIQRVMPSRT